MSLPRRKIFNMNGSFQKVCYLERTGAKTKVVIDHVNYFIHTEEKTSSKKNH